MSVAEHLNAIKATLPAKVSLVAVSKTHPVERIMEAYAAGQRIFGENKVQELVAKWEEMPKDIEWHLIGHLQSNKIKYIAPFVALIHSVDGLSLLKEINKQGEKNQRVIPCLLQVHIAREETKFGLSPEECLSLLTSDELNALQHIRIRGLMGMATNTDDTTLIRSEFQGLKQFYETLRQRNDLPVQVEMSILSMGMSSDYPLAIEEGSTMVRVGSSIFGYRNYP